MDLTIDPIGPGAACLKLAGRLDSPGVDEVERQFVAAARDAGGDVLVDLSAVPYVSSMGLRMLISTARALLPLQRRLVLFGAQPLVKEMLDTVALERIIPIAADRAGAQAVLGS